MSDINDVIDRDDIDVKIGSELVLENVSIDKARITLKENFENPGCLCVYVNVLRMLACIRVHW